MKSKSDKVVYGNNIFILIAEEYYSMNGKVPGYLLIIHVEQFKNKRGKIKGEKTRHGTVHDAKALKNVFGKILGFKVIERKNPSAKVSITFIFKNAG